MPTFEVEFEVYCAKCGAGLCNQTKTDDASFTYSYPRMAQVHIEPCRVCLQEANAEGFDKGYDEGKKEPPNEI